MKKWKIYFVPHSHWDKEWYFSKESSSVFLIDNFLKLKEIENDSKKFKSHVFDSQLSVVDDYLEFHPQDIDWVKKIIREKKLIVGPWYSQPDMFSPSGEALLRNLSYGKYFSKELGHSAKQAYTPDSFGFNSNLPQLLKINECDAIIQWRGVESENIDTSVFCEWTGIDGSKVFLYNMFKYGYGLTFWAFNSIYKKWNKNNLGELAKEYLEKFLTNKNEDLKILKERNKNTNNTLVFPFGSDQSPIIEWLPLFIEELNKIDKEHEWILCDYDFFIEEIKNKTKEKEIKQINGELKYGQYSRTHRTIGSSRQDIKSLSKEVEYLLFSVAEPLGLIYEKFTGKYPVTIYNKALKMLLESQAHDSLGGSCVDIVNFDVYNRLRKAKEMLISQNTLIKRRIVEYLNLDETKLLVFNLAPFPREVFQDMKIITKSKKFKIHMNNEPIEFFVKNTDFYNRTDFKNEYNSLAVENIAEKGFYISEVVIKTPMIDGLGYLVLDVYDDHQDVFRGKIAQKVESNKIEDNNYLIEQLDGEFKIINKKTKKIVIGYLEYTQDAGDTYDFSPKKNSDIITKPDSVKTYTEISGTVKSLHVNFIYNIPEELNSNSKIKQKIDMSVKLFGDNEPEFNFEIENKAKDYRWRFVIDAWFENEYSFADQTSSLIKRDWYETSRMKRWEKEKWKDMPIAIENFYSFVYLSSLDGHKVGIHSKNLNEYEINPENKKKLNITLLRGVSLLGRRDLMYRPGRASGINDFACETPESNLIRKTNIKFSLIFTKSIVSPRNIALKYGHSDYFQTQRVSDYIFAGQTFWKPIVSQLKQKYQISNIFKSLPNEIVITAFKKSWDEKNIIIRLANISNKEIELKSILEKNLEIWITNGLEKVKKPIPDTIGPNQIITLLMNKI